MQEPIRIGVLVGKTSESLQFIIDACRIRCINGQVIFVGALSSNAEGIKVADRNEIPRFFVDYETIAEELRGGSTKYSVPDFDLNKEVRCAVANGPQCIGEIRKRVFVDGLLLAEIKKHDYDLLIMDGYTRLVSCFLIDAVNSGVNGVSRFLSSHSSLLPSFDGLRARERAFDSGVCVAGSSIIEVNYEMDSGRIIDQRAFYVERPCTREHFFATAERNEKTLYVHTLRNYTKDNYKKLKRA